MTIDPQTPVLVGVGQRTQRWSAADGAEAAPSPQSLRADAARLALADCGADPAALSAAIDRVVVVRTFLDSLPGAPARFGRCANPPRRLATDIGLTGVKSAIYSVAGGDQPQALVNEAAEAIHAGDVRAVLIAGAEAEAALKAAARAGIDLSWGDDGADLADAVFDDRGLGPILLSRYEIANGLGMPTQTYPAIEHALRARWGLSREQWRVRMSELWSLFSQVAAANPHAAFPTARSSEWLATASAENYPVSDPHLKWHVAQDAVNQGAAVVMMAAGEAARLGIDPDRWVHLHGYAAASDSVITRRPDLSRSRAIELTLDRALAAAGKRAADIAHFDIYSCFPCVVLLAAEALGIDWRETALTVTGGLSFFGGPGNDYSLHAIATMAERLRADPGSFGLVLANGGFISKEAVGVYSTVPKSGWAPVPSDDLQAAIDGETGPPLLEQDCVGTIATYGVAFAKGAPERGYVIADADGGGRVLARIARGDSAIVSALIDSDPAGRRVTIVHEGGINIIKALD